MSKKLKARQPRARKKRGHYGPAESEPLEKILVSVYASDAAVLRRMANYNKFVRLAVREKLEA